MSQRANVKIAGAQKFRGAKISNIFRQKIRTLLIFQTRRHLARKNQARWLNTSSALLIKLLGRDYYRRVVDFCVDHGFLETNHHYWVGRYPKSYRVPPAYLRDFVEIPANLKFEPLVLCPELSRLTFSEAGRADFAARLKRFHNPFRIACWKYAFHSIERRQFWESRHDPTGRIFSNVTSLPKMLRRHLLLDGEPTVEIDIANSQPFFAATLYETESTERSRYLALVQSGEFYENLNRQLVRAHTDRDRLKRAVYREVFFGAVSDTKPLWRAFQKLFPELARKFAARKAPEIAGQTKSNRLALDLQRREAKVMIEATAQQAREAGLPIVSVHDSLICKASHAEQVGALLAKNFAAQVKAVPKFRISSG